MKNEETNYNDESTQYDGAQANSQEVKNDENNAQTGKTKKEATWRKVVFGTSAGILLGGATSFAATKVMFALAISGVWALQQSVRRVTR